MSIFAAAASLLSSQLVTVAPTRPLLIFCCAQPFLRTYAQHTPARTGKVNKHRRLPSAPYASTFHIPSTASIRSLYRNLLRAASRFPDDLVRRYIVARCKNQWREHRAAHRETYQTEQHAAYEKQKARLQVRERLQRIQAGESDEAATRKALDRSFDPLQLPPQHSLHIATDTPHVSIDLRRTIDQRYRDAQHHLHLLQSALSHPDQHTLIHSRTEVLCAAYGWQGGPLLDRLFHLRNMYFNAPNMLKPHTLLALHPLHRYLITGVRPEDERPVAAGSRRPTVGVYEWWPVAVSDRLRGESLVSGVRWMECYRLLIMERCQVLDVEWRRAYSDMLKQRQIIGAPGEIEQPGSAVARKQRSEASEEQTKEGEESKRKQMKSKDRTKDV